MTGIDELLKEITRLGGIIRVLESELAVTQEAGREATRIGREWVARAENAEAELGEWRTGKRWRLLSNIEKEYAELVARAEKAEARFAEWESHPLRSPSDEQQYWYTRFKMEKTRVAELRRYAEHHAECELKRKGGESCTCGLNDIEGKEKG